MPTLQKIDKATFDATVETQKAGKNCLPTVQVLDGNITQISDDLNILVPRGMYQHVVFVPDALLGEFRWNRIFRRNTPRWNQVATKKGVLFLFH